MWPGPLEVLCGQVQLTFLPNSETNILSKVLWEIKMETRLLGVLLLFCCSPLGKPTRAHWWQKAASRNQDCPATLLKPGAAPEQCGFLFFYFYLLQEQNPPQISVNSLHLYFSLNSQQTFSHKWIHNSVIWGYAITLPPFYNLSLNLPASA